MLNTHNAEYVVTLAVYRDRLTKQIQVSIEDPIGGYRILGPTFLGDSTLLAKTKLTKRDAVEIAAYLTRLEAV